MSLSYVMALAGAITLYCAAPAAQVHLKSRTVQPSATVTAQFVRTLGAAPGNALHGLAVLSRSPSDDERKRLESAGIRLLSPFSGSTYRVRVEKGVDPAKIKIGDLAIQLVALAAEDRVEPDIWRGDFARYRIPAARQKAGNFVLNEDGTLTLTVRLYPDVDEAAAKATLARHAKSYRQESGAAWIVVVERAALGRLAAEESVQWIDAGPLPYFAETSDVRAFINVDALQNFNFATGVPQGLGGRGVQVGIFDKGIDQTHPDVAGSVIIDEAPLNSHATHLGCTVAGNGVHSDQNDSWGSPNGGSAYQWRGMAPLAQLIDGDQTVAQQASKHLEYITNQGMDVSLHSYKFSFDGAYDSNNQVRDELVRGDALSGLTRVPGRLQVVSAGNDGNLPQYPQLGANQRGYFALTKQVKNALVVGNWDRMAAKIHPTSSLGPAHDGRIKPDVVAPGIVVKSCGYCALNDEASHCRTNGTIPLHQNYYRPSSGSSVSAAVTAGVVALALEQYATSYGFNLDQTAPLPSTLRGVLIHTAADRVHSGSVWHTNADGPVKPEAGPDFVTGWGLIDAQAARNLVASRRILEGIVPGTCHVRTYSFQMPPGGPPRVTLTWDDVAADPAAPITHSKLINDLDLVLIAPNGVAHYPWKLDQKIVDANANVIPDAAQYCGTAIDVQREFMPVANPVYDPTNPANNVNDTIPAGGVPAAVRGPDHLNNVEVVDVTPAAGTWVAKVIGFRVAQGPQKFSLVGADFMPLLVHPTSLCTRYPVLCRKLAIRLDLCERYPKLCETRISFPAPGRIRLQFVDGRQKLVLPLDAPCRHALSCPPCATASSCRAHDLEIVEAPAVLRAAIYSSNGDLIKGATPINPSQRLRFPARSGERYFLVLSPGPGTKLGADYDLSLRLN